VEEQYDELWTFTDWGRACAVDGGLAPERVRVVPLGVDLTAFVTDGPVHELTQQAATTFLFVGAAVHRKGADVAVRAFLEAFDASDDVRLVVKDHTGDVFYRGLSQRDEILEAADRPGAAPVTYLDAYLPQPELAALYRGATAIVAPSRAEGWALPVQEAMACGTPAIVPDYGPFRTSCTPDSAVFVRSRRVRLPVQRAFVVNTLGFEEHVETIDVCETSIPALAAAMRDVAGWSEPRRRQRSRGARAAAARHSWASSAETVAAAVADLVGPWVG